MKRIPESERILPDVLSDKATEIAIGLIEDNGGMAYLESMTRIFKAALRLIEDVAPEVREQLRQKLGLLSNN